jgi:hypothetical protein
MVVMKNFNLGNFTFLVSAKTSEILGSILPLKIFAVKGGPLVFDNFLLSSSSPF